MSDKSEYAPTGSTLFLSICSGTKNASGKGNVPYNESDSIKPKLSSSGWAALIQGRQTALSVLNREYYNGTPLKDYRYNRGLIPGPDFGKPMVAGDDRYLPAASLYSGRFYLTLGKEGMDGLNASPHHMLIVSGLFGLVTPAEPIQLYECPLEDLPAFSDVWQKDNRLTNVLLDYIRTNNITTIVDLTAQQEYRSLINWKLLNLREGLRCLHVHNQDHVADEGLPHLGAFTRDVLIPMTDDQLHAIDAPRMFEANCLSPDILPPEGWPLEESRRVERMIRDSENRRVEYKATLIGNAKIDLPRDLGYSLEMYRNMKAVASFMNTEGGDLLIGVNDNNAVVGIGSDLNRLRDQRNSRDYYLQVLDQMVVEYLGKSLTRYVTPEFRSINQKWILRIRVEHSECPAILRLDQDGMRTRQYWIRANASCRELRNNREQASWMQTHSQRPC